MTFMQFIESFDEIAVFAGIAGGVIGLVLIAIADWIRPS